MNKGIKIWINKLKKNKFTILSLGVFILASILFYFLKEWRLLVGGVIFLILGFKMAVIDVKRKINKEDIGLLANHYSTAFLLFVIGIISITAYFFLPNYTNLFLVISLFCIMMIIILESFLLQYHNPINKITHLFMFLLISSGSIYTLGAIINSINKEGISSMWFYIQLIIFVAVSIWSLSILIQFTWKLIKSVLNDQRTSLFDNNHNVTIAIVIHIIFGGYYYLTLVSPREKVLDNLLIMLGILLTIWLAISESMRRENIS